MHVIPIIHNIIRMLKFNKSISACLSILPLVSYAAVSGSENSRFIEYINPFTLESDLVTTFPILAGLTVASAR